MRGDAFGKNTDETYQPGGTRLRAFLAIVFFLIAGAGFAWWMAGHYDRHMRDDLLYRARMAAQAVDHDLVGTLTGTRADLTSPDYLLLKRQLASAKAAYRNCRFIYLMGRRGDNQVFFFVDGEPVGSKDESPAGQVYDEITEEDRRVFDQKVALTSGPSADRWGTWVSAMVPIVDPDTGELAAVLGMDVAAHEWKMRLLGTAWPPILFALAMVLITALGSGLIVRFSRRVKYPPRHWESAFFAAVVGLFLTVLAAWIAHEKEADARGDAFRQLAEAKTKAAAKTLETLQDVELEAVARFFEASVYVSPHEFRDYTDYLLENRAVKSWEWIRPIEDREKERIESECRAEGMAGFEIWESGGEGKRSPASGREVYYPVMRVAPLGDNEKKLGYDLGFDPGSREILSSAKRPGVIFRGPSPGLEEETKGIETLLFFRPVFSHDESHDPRGFAAAEIPAENLLSTSGPDRAAPMMISLGRPLGDFIILASSPDFERAPEHLRPVRRPVFVFGECFIITAREGKDFIGLYPAKSWWLVGLAGMTITLSLAALGWSTQRKRGQLEEMVDERARELVEARDRAELAVAGADLATWDWDVKSETVSFNENWTRIFGREADGLKLSVKDWSGLAHPEDLPELRKNVMDHLEGQSDSIEIESRFMHREGHYVWVLIKGRVIERGADGSPLRVCGTYLNVTEQKRALAEREQLMDQLVQTRKMEAVGRLAGGVAHDLNNLLSPIIGYGELLLEDSSLNEEARESLEDMLEAGLRARDLVGQLLSFSRKQTLEMKPVDVNKIVLDFEKLLRRTIPEDVEIVIALSPEARAVMADVGLIEQVIMNLAVNAAEVMPEGGKLTIETAMTELDEEYAASRPDVKPGPYFMLAVGDTGQGMDKDTLDKVFEPFFTTKGEGGTGLGLATVFGIVKQHGGNILVYSEPGKGSVFKVYLPARDDAPVEEGAKRKKSSGLSGSETILLAEDHEEARAVAAAVLERHGYQVIAARDGHEALRIAAGHSGQIHLLLTDVVMPGMNGRELHGEIIKKYKDIKVIYMSGYTDNVIAHRGVLDEGIHFVQKPFTVQALTAKIREILDEDAGDGD